MANENVHAIALQIAQAAQKYEQLWAEMEALNARYAGTQTWVESLLGEPSDDFRAIFGNITESKDLYLQSVLRCRNSLLKVSQALIKLSQKGDKE